MLEDIPVLNPFNWFYLFGKKPLASINYKQDFKYVPRQLLLLIASIALSPARRFTSITALLPAQIPVTTFQ